jgi:hypothetical protein
LAEAAPRAAPAIPAGAAREIEEGGDAPCTERTRRTARLRLGALYRLWDARRGGRPAPSRRDFLPEDIKAWMPNIVIVGVEGPMRFRLRLIGTEVVEHDGADYTGLLLDEVLEGETRRVVTGQFAPCADEVRPMAFRYRTDRFHGIRATLNTLFLPMSADGPAVGQVLACLYLDLDRRAAPGPDRAPGKGRAGEGARGG